MLKTKIITGTLGNDKLVGGAGNQILVGLQGNDIINGGDGFDISEGGAGNDTYFISTALDSVIENSSQGFDTIIAPCTVSLPSNVEAVTLIGSKNSRVRGNKENNVINGNNSNNDISGAAGNDSINSGAGNDDVDGFTGDDLLNGGAGNDKITGFTGNDTMLGGTGDDMLRGGDGNDSITGDSGNDTLRGGLGNDTLTGGAGSDRFGFGGDGLFNASTAGVDKVNDFSIGNDKVLLVKKSFNTISSSLGRGFSNASEFGVFTSDGAAKGSTADIAYNTNNGNLFYNDKLIATFAGGPDLTAKDFSISL